MRPARPSEPDLLGSFEEQVLLAVLRTGEDAYGMVVRRELEEVTNRPVTIGSVYATLDRLEAKGLVGSSRVPRGQPNSRRVFSVTSTGHRALQQTRAVRERLWHGIRLRRPLHGA